ncbi:hypothetical protein CKA32_007045 [Geitlerinema sp. FC II]|nr:hypothetical protein CKA32_007045 [Geitlerinema sp. FC II]
MPSNHALKTRKSVISLLLFSQRKRTSVLPPPTLKENFDAIVPAIASEGERRSRIQTPPFR